MSESTSFNRNQLGVDPISRLLFKFAVPSIIAMLVSSLYNIVDQFFIGQKIGELGNAATNIAFPLNTSCTALALLFGVGGASAFNLAMGEASFDAERKKDAVSYFGCAASMLFICGTVLLMITQLFLKPLLCFFGSPDNVLSYAQTYTRITSLGFPFLIFSIGGGHLLRADGRPRHTMLCNLTGALVNTVLDALFVFVLDWGMAGAAGATVIGQLISFLLVSYFIRHTRTISLKAADFIPHLHDAKYIASLGAAPCSNQIAMMVVQIVLNNSLKYYGSRSVYGEAIPIACVGIISKVNMIYMSFVIGTSQGLQPITGYNYGARNYGRVKKAYFTACGCTMAMSVVFFLLFQLFPRQITSVFGNGSEEYFAFSIKYFRIFLFFTFINFLQPLTSNFFTSIGKPVLGIILSLTRQIIFLLPLIIIFPVFMGIDGIMYAGPIADFCAMAVCLVMAVIELKKMH